MKCALPHCGNEAIVGVSNPITEHTVWMCQAEFYAYILSAKTVLENFAEAILAQQVNDIIEGTQA